MKMKMYYSVGTTPLMFHKFYHLVMTPLNFVMAVFLIYQAFVGQTELNWLGMGYNVLLLVACVLTFVGCFKFRSYAWWAIIGSFVLEIVYDSYFVIAVGMMDTSLISAALMQIGWRPVAIVLMAVYYIKRRPLFFNPITEEEVSQAVAESGKTMKSIAHYDTASIGPKAADEPNEGDQEAKGDA